MSNYPGALSGGWITHRFQSLKPDQPDLSLVNPTQWNQSHIIGSGAIQSGALGANMVNSGNVSANAIISGNVASGAVVYGTLASGAISSGGLAANSVVSGDLASGAVTYGTVASGAISSGAHGSSSVVSGNVAALAITSGVIASGATSWNLFGPSKPFVTVTPNGPTDGGDYGPNTVGTTTAGIQEAINSLTGGGTVWVQHGAYTVTSNISHSSNVVIIFDDKVSITWGSNFLIIKGIQNAGVISLGEFDDTFSTAPVLSIPLKIDNTTASVSGIYFKGFKVPAMTVTVSTNGNYSMSFITFDRLYFALSATGITWTNTGLLQYPAQWYFLRCQFVVAGTNPVFTSAPVLGQWTIRDCHLNLENNNAIFYQLTANAYTTMLIIDGFDIYLNPSITGVKLIDFENGATIAILAVENLYVEDHSPITLFSIPSGASNEFSAVFSHIYGDGIAVGGNTLANIVNAPTHLSRILFDDIQELPDASAGWNVGTLPAMTGTGLLAKCRNVRGLTDAGFITPPAVPASTSYWTNNDPYTHRVYITGIGTGISAYSIKDLYANVQAFTVTVNPGFLKDVEPGESLALTYTGTPTWKHEAQN